MMRPTALFLLALSVAAGGVVFHVSFEVSELHERLRALNHEIAEDREAIHVLHAEWSYLNQPDRLSEMTARYLELEPLDGRQFAGIDAVPIRLDPGLPAEDDAAAAPALAEIPQAAVPRAKPQPPARLVRAAQPPARPAQAVAQTERTFDALLRTVLGEGGGQ